MVQFNFTPEQGITFTLYANFHKRSIRELTGKGMSVTILRRSGVPLDVLVRLEDPAHPNKTWTFNSSKVNDDGVPFRRFNLVQGVLRATGFYGDEDVDWFNVFASECLLIAKTNELDLEEPEWSLDIDRRFLFATEHEMLSGSIPYACPFGSVPQGPASV